MFYITKCYVGHAGTTLRPGEAFEADSKDEKINWLLQQKAIVPATPAFAPVEHEDANDDQQGDAQDNQENHRLQMENLGYDASGNPLEVDDADDEVEEAPEIDGLDGIVTDDTEATEPAEEAPSKKKNGRKKA